MKTLLLFALVAVPVAAVLSEDALPFSFTNVAEKAGLEALTVFGGREQNRYLLETTGCGAALFDYDNDGWLDAFLVNGTTLEGFPKGEEPKSHLYRNRRDGSFEDVTLYGVIHRFPVPASAVTPLGVGGILLVGEVCLGFPGANH